MEQPNTIFQLQRELALLRDENRRLNRCVLQYTMENAVRDEFLSQALSYNMGRFFGCPVTPWYLLLLFHGKKPAAGEEGRSIPPENPLDLVQNGFGPVLEAYGAPFFFAVTGTIACLLNLTTFTEPDGIGDDSVILSRRIQSELNHRLNQNPKTTVVGISMSRISTLEDGPRPLYRCAEMVSENRTGQTAAVFSEYDFPDEERANLRQVFTLEPQFWRQIQQHQFFNAAGTFDALTRASRSGRNSLERSLATVFSRMELVLQTIGQETGRDLSRDDEFSAMMFSLARSQTYEAMEDTAHDLLAEMEDRFYTPDNARNRKMSGIEQYIRDHYDDQNLCAAAISDQFKISASYLSRIFRTDMGIGVVDYIHNVRIEAAKRLLFTTELGLDEIARQVGFSNHWVFIRAFKKQEGITPGVFRTGRQPKAVES